VSDQQTPKDVAKTQQAVNARFGRPEDRDQEADRLEDVGFDLNTDDPAEAEDGSGTEAVQRHWKRLRRAFYCSGCDMQFHSQRAFDVHRTGPVTNRRCLNSKRSSRSVSVTALMKSYRLQLKQERRQEHKARREEAALTWEEATASVSARPWVLPMGRRLWLVFLAFACLVETLLAGLRTCLPRHALRVGNRLAAELSRLARLALGRRPTAQLHQPGGGAGAALVVVDCPPHGLFAQVADRASMFGRDDRVALALRQLGGLDHGALVAPLLGCQVAVALTKHELEVGGELLVGGRLARRGDLGVGVRATLEQIELRPGAATDRCLRMVANNPDTVPATPALTGLVAALAADYRAGAQPAAAESAPGESAPVSEGDIEGMEAAADAGAAELGDAHARNAAIVADRAAGMSFGKLADKYGLSKATVHAIAKDAEVAA
jgi:hypothetical protein